MYECSVEFVQHYLCTIEKFGELIKTGKNIGPSNLLVGIVKNGSVKGIILGNLHDHFPYLQ